jgi:isocitrate dehydrogenase (NAD+)
VLPLFGSIAGSESMLVAFESDDFEPTALMAEAAHGTAPSLEGKNVANPMAMILAVAALLSQTDEGQTAGRAIRESALEAVAQGIKTADLGGHSSTTEYTDEVIRRTKTKLEIWSSL